MKVVQKPVGKGDKRRPSVVSDEELERRWMVAFGRCPRCGATRDSLGPFCDFCVADMMLT